MSKCPSKGPLNNLSDKDLIARPETLRQQAKDLLNEKEYNLKKEVLKSIQQCIIRAMQNGAYSISVSNQDINFSNIKEILNSAGYTIIMRKDHDKDMSANSTILWT